MRSALLAGAIRLEQVGDRFRSPVHLASPPGDARLFVVEQAGRIRIVKNGAIVAQPFLDIVERYNVSSNPDLADASSAKLVLGIDQPHSNHNGGLAMFGPDGMLWIGTGDGGSGGDPHGNGQLPFPEPSGDRQARMEDGRHRARRVVR